MSFTKQQRRTGNNRLLKLADFLAKLPRNRFDYNYWVGVDWGGKQDLSCGTTACALGWAATMPTFRRLGLHLRQLMGDTARVCTPRNFGSYAASAEIFMLEDHDSSYLFTPQNGEPKRSAKFVAKKIRRWVTEHPA